jgi:mono/diheme cytochrome c family protein
MVSNFGRQGVFRGAVVLALCAAVALPMAASTATSATVKVTVGKPREMTFTIVPSKVSAGTVTFQVTNAGKVAHAFQVCSSPLGGIASKCAGPKTKTIAPGKTAKLVANLGIGKHEYLDPVTGHSAAKGMLLVIAASPAAGGGTTTTTPSKGGTTGGSGGSGSGGGTTTTTTTGTGGASGNLVGDPVAGATVFATAGCTSCHTLKAANATGGIDLDAFAPDQPTVIDNVSNGNTGGMPDFSTQLTKAQINNVASYVFCVTHGHTPQNC